MNKTYSKFMREKIDKDYNDFIVPDYTGNTSHGSDKESFKHSYEEVYDIKGIKIYHLDNPEILRVGYVVDYGAHKIWHTVRLGAWGQYKNFEKEFPESIKYTKFTRFEIMEI